MIAAACLFAQNRDNFKLAVTDDVHLLHLLPCHANKQLNACFNNEECALCSESLANATQQHSCDTAQDHLLDLVPADCNLDEGLLFDLIECEFEVFKNCEPESVVSAAPAAAAVQRGAWLLKGAAALLTAAVLAAAC
jgi:hypothetical protein